MARQCMCGSTSVARLLSVLHQVRSASSFGDSKFYGQIGLSPKAGERQMLWIGEFGNLRTEQWQVGLGARPG